VSLRLANRWGTVIDAEIPAKRWGIALASKAALDEVFFATEFATAPLVARSEFPRIAREIAEATDLFEQRGWFESPKRYYQTPSCPSSAAIVSARCLFGDFQHLTFESGYEPYVGEPGRERWLSYEANRTAHAWLLEHEGEPRPWLVCVPGYRMGNPVVDFAGFSARWLHKTLGLNVAIPVLPLHGPRQKGRRGGDGFLTGDFLDTLHALTQGVWDVRRLLAWLREEKNPPKVGVHGVSLGGYTVSLLACLEKKIDCVIAGIPMADFLRMIRSTAPSFLLRAAGKMGLALEDVERLFEVISPLSIPATVPRQKRFLYAGLADRLATPDHAFALWHHWDRPRSVWYQGSHVSFMWERNVKDLITEALTDCGLNRPGIAGGSGVPQVWQRRLSTLSPNAS
jgi:hypothetical protein